MMLLRGVLMESPKDLHHMSEDKFNGMLTSLNLEQARKLIYI